MEPSESIFLHAREITDPVDRQAYLKDACGADAERRAQIDKMLCDADAAADYFGLTKEDSHNTHHGSHPTPGQRFSDYELIEEIARGGMGIVFKARQLRLNRIVALKLILSGQFANRQEVLRFRGEAEAAANLRHPNIVTIYETGEYESQHYFSMEYVPGRDLAALVRDGCLSAERAARYVEKIAHAIHYAHQQGTLHRDLKPSNVLIDSNDQPRITDFGLAKRLRDDFGLTVTGQMLGSPSFMPPEQMAGNRKPVGPPSDVYGIGAILYHLLSGRAPFQAESIVDVLRQVQEQDPVSPRRLNPSVPRDLETICMKCLAKEPARRYATAAELADELGRFLRNEPIQARPAGTSERLWRWCCRKPAATTALALLVVVAIGSPLAAWRLNRARQFAESNRQLAEARLYGADLTLVAQALDAGNPTRARELLEVHRPQRGLPDFRGFEWRYFWEQCHADQELTLRGHGGEVSGLSFSPDGRLLASCGADSTLKLWNLETKQEITTLRGHKTWVNNAVFSPDGRVIASASDDATVKLWSVADHFSIATLSGHSGKVLDLRFSRDGATLASCGEDGTVRLWEVSTHKSSGVLQHHGMILSCDFSPDGALLATGGSDQCVTLWDVRSRQVIGTLPSQDHEVQRMAFSPTGRFLATASEGESIVVWEVSTLREAARLKSDGARFTYVAFSPDGAALAASSRNGRIKVWDIASLRETATFFGHAGGVWLVEFAPDGRSVATGGMDGTVKIWELGNRKKPNGLEQRTNLVWQALFAPSGRKLACWESSSLRLSASALRIDDLEHQSQNNSGLSRR